MVRMIEVSRRLRQTLLLVMLSLLMWAVCLLSVWVNFLPKSEYEAKRPSLSEQRISSIDPVVMRANNELVKSIRLSTDRVTNTVKGLIDQESDKAATHFKRTVSAVARSAPDIHDAIKLTLVQNVCKALGE
ncbi:hypothetical protein F7734_28575 [Scytonema sp. UIC 10036]|uniref:hypothetical protein n=1 Tax=Scytonema sp. UIC 10036 TaxID=2304196 RepID=UPI0012DA5648|nr:hypothetical protein [Scytonema sp. UIC 10036]MUG96083.1 hypothetical protein [Scytonema sp. UIC 10036]